LLLEHPDYLPTYYHYGKHLETVPTVSYTHLRAHET
jgi:hypothetical protein